jgi:hypothetical protein
MEALFFAVWVLIAPNPWDVKDGVMQPYLVPIEQSTDAFRAAEDYPDVLREELTGMLIGEHASGYPYPADSIGDSGKAYGLYQVRGREVREYNKARGASLKLEDLLDPHTAASVGAWLIHRHKGAHVKRAYCKEQVTDSVEVGPDGSIRPVYRDQKHNWIAHWKCGVNLREACRTKRRSRIIAQLGLHRRFYRLWSRPLTLAFAEVTRYRSADEPISTDGDIDDGIQMALGRRDPRDPTPRTRE